MNVIKTNLIHITVKDIKILFSHNKRAFNCVREAV